MSSNIPFETALMILAVAYVAPLMLLLAVSNVGISVIETLEEIVADYKTPSSSNTSDKGTL